MRLEQMMSKERLLLEEIDKHSRIYGECLPANLADALQEVLSQHQKNRLIEVYSDLLKSLIENDGAGLKELEAFDLETYNKLKSTFGVSELLAQPEQTEQEPVRYEYQDSDGMWCLFESRLGHYTPHRKSVSL
jgi:hypothetical protein